MAAIGFGRSIVKPYLTPGVVLACENSSESVTISGDETAVEDTIARILLDHPDALARKLEVEVAYHSHHMADVGPMYESLIEEDFRGAGFDLVMPFYSSVTGKTYVNLADLGASYWRMNLESPVLFYTAVKDLLIASGISSAMLDVGPHSALQGPLKQVFKEIAPSAVYASSLIRNVDSTVKS